MQLVKFKATGVGMTNSRTGALEVEGSVQYRAEGVGTAYGFEVLARRAIGAHDRLRRSVERLVALVDESSEGHQALIETEAELAASQERDPSWDKVKAEILSEALAALAAARPMTLDKAKAFAQEKGLNFWYDTAQRFWTLSHPSTAGNTEYIAPNQFAGYTEERFLQVCDSVVRSAAS